MRLFFPLLFVLVFFGEGRCQKTFPLFKNEIGLDAAPWARGDAGGSLILKKGLWSQTGEKKQRQNALRLIGGYYEEKYSAGVYYFRMDSLHHDFTNNGLRKIAFCYLGDELQIRYNRWQFHFGVDIGYRRIWSNADYEHRITRVGLDTLIGQEFHQFKARSNGFRVGGFGGVDFFLFPRLSIGLEVLFEGGPNFERADTLENGAVTYSNKFAVFETDIKWLRLLYLSWHFGGRGSIEKSSESD